MIFLPLRPVSAALRSLIGGAASIFSPRNIAGEGWDGPWLTLRAARLRAELIYSCGILHPAVQSKAQ